MRIFVAWLTQLLTTDALVLPLLPMNIRKIALGVNLRLQTTVRVVLGQNKGGLTIDVLRSSSSYRLGIYMHNQNFTIILNENRQESDCATLTNRYF